MLHRQAKKSEQFRKQKPTMEKEFLPQFPMDTKKSPDNPKQWIIDEPAAEVVRYIYKLCLEELGLTQIAKRLRAEKILCPTAYFEPEQKELRESLSNLEQSIIDAETEKVDMKRFLETIRECTELKELTPKVSIILLLCKNITSTQLE